MDENIQRILDKLKNLPEDKRAEIMGDLTLKISKAEKERVNNLVNGYYERSISDSNSDYRVNLDVTKDGATLHFLPGRSRLIRMNREEFDLLLDICREIIEKIDEDVNDKLADDYIERLKKFWEEQEKKMTKSWPPYLDLPKPPYQTPQWFDNGTGGQAPWLDRTYCTSNTKL